MFGKPECQPRGSRERASPIVCNRKGSVFPAELAICSGAPPPPVATGCESGNAPSDPQSTRIRGEAFEALWRFAETGSRGGDDCRWLVRPDRIWWSTSGGILRRGDLARQSQTRSIGASSRFQAGLVHCVQGHFLQQGMRHTDVEHVNLAGPRRGVELIKSRFSGHECCRVTGTHTRSFEAS